MKFGLTSTLAVGIFILPVIFGCSNDNVQSPTTAVIQPSEEALAKLLPSPDKKNKALKIANKFLSSECVQETNANWATNSAITDAFPVYLDGVDDVSYYECKVKKNGVDAGYILVNINQTDIKIPQYCTEGKTPSEEFAKESGVAINNLQVFRQDWFTMVAEKKTAIGLGNGTPVIARGFDGSGDFFKGSKINQQMLISNRQAFAKRVRDAGGVNPSFQRQSLRQAYNRDSLVAEVLKSYPKGLSKSAGTGRWTSDELNNTFACGWHLPKWYQVTNEANMLSGCGPLALTMMYAYHRQFTGKTKLFNGLDLNSNVSTPFGVANASSLFGSWDEIIRGAAFKIGADCGATYGSNGTGVSLNALENNGELYGDQLGYNVVLDQDLGGDFTKGKTALSHIRGERPCMFQFDPDRNGTIDHYGVIEGVKYLEMKYVWNWYSWEMWYLVNYAWYNDGNGKREWICVDAQYSSNATEYKNTGNLYMEWK